MYDKEYGTKMLSGWYKWRRILDRITSHKDYRYDAPYNHKSILLNMAKFASNMMAEYNTKYWNNGGVSDANLRSEVDNYLIHQFHSR